MCTVRGKVHNLITQILYQQLHGEYIEMATPISYGLVLEGEDARDFEEYMKNPTFTEEGRQLMREVKAELRARGLE